MEDVEKILERVEHKQPATPAEQPEIPTQTGDVHVQDKEVEKSRTIEESTMNKMMEMFLREFKSISEKLSQDLHKKLDSFVENFEERSKKMVENFEERNKKMVENLSKKMDDWVIDIKNDNKLFREKLREDRLKREELRNEKTKEIKNDLSLIHI